MKSLFPWSCGIAGIILLAAGSLRANEPTDSYSFHSQRTVGSIDRVEAAFDVGGDVKVVEDSKVNRLRMSVLANLTYDERTLELPQDANSKGAWRSIRYYDNAEAAIQVDGQEVKPALGDQRRLIGVEAAAAEVTLFSPHGPMTREELDLIDLLGNSLLMDRLLPDHPVRVGDQWKHSAELMTALLGLDAVSEADASSTLLTVTDERARFEMSGRVAGAIGGVATEIELKSKYHFDRKANRVTWFGLLVKENRSVGHVGPGLEVTARLQMKIVPDRQSPQLTDEALAGLTLKPSPALLALNYGSAEGGWEFAHDRNWHVTSDAPKLAVLRLVERGEFVAQCKVSSLPDATTGKELTLAEFQKDIQHGLGANFGQFIEASQSANEHNYRVYRVVVEGEASDLPIRWLYYYVADQSGRQVVLAFTVEGRLLDAFGKADERLLDAMRLREPQLAAKPATQQ
jgi:hypothetical protein